MRRPSEWTPLAFRRALNPLRSRRKEAAALAWFRSRSAAERHYLACSLDLARRASEGDPSAARQLAKLERLERRCSGTSELLGSPELRALMASVCRGAGRGAHDC